MSKYINTRGLNCKGPIIHKTIELKKSLEPSENNLPDKCVMGLQHNSIGKSNVVAIKHETLTGGSFLNEITLSKGKKKKRNNLVFTYK